MKLSPGEGPKGYYCTPATCHPACALAVIDDLLRAASAVRAEEVDALLDLRWLLHRREDAEAALQLFCTLRRSMEERHYLAFYRLRRWLENQIEACIRLRRGTPEKIVPLKIERYCLEAVRSCCLERVRGAGEPVLSAKVRFCFRCPAQPRPRADFLLSEFETEIG